MGEIRIKPTETGQVIEQDGKTLADSFNILVSMAGEFQERLAQVNETKLSKADREAFDYLERFAVDLDEALYGIEHYIMFNTEGECDFYWKEPS